ncbi:MAG: alpha/beta hydrolase [Pseudomonadota bacterium]
MDAFSIFEPGDGRRIAYHKVPPRGDGVNRPGVVFLGGFKSDMTGTKAQALEEWARTEGRAFVRFDYTGHGASSGQFLDGCIGDWARDARDVLDALTEGPQILVGSSMGGWISLLVARAMPHRVAGLVGIAAAPDFTEIGMWAAMDEAIRTQLMEEGQIEEPSEYSDEPYVITKRLIEDGRTQQVLNQPLVLPFPVRLLHGTADVDVPMDWPLRLLEHAECPDMRLLLLKGSDHRLSEPDDLAAIRAAVEEVTARAQIG